MSPGGFPSGSLAGLTPEQVAQIAQVDSQREQLRQRSVGSVIDSFNIESEINRRELAGELDRAQTERFRTLAKFAPDQARAALEATQANTAATRGAESRAAALQPSALKSAQAGAREYTVTGPDGQKFIITGDQIPSVLSGQASSANAAARLGESRARREETQENRRQVREVTELKISESRKKSALERVKDAADAESNLMSPPVDKNGKALPAEALAAQADVFNAISEKPYVYVYFPGVVGETFAGLDFLNPDTPGENRRINIPSTLATPSRPAKQFSAREIYDLAMASQYKDVRKFLELEFFPSIGQQAPWLTEQ